MTTETIKRTDYVVESASARSLQLGGLGVRFLAEMSDAPVGIVEHPMEPRSLGSPVHTHQREDEYSFVLEGEVGVQIGDEMFVAGPGTLVRKPRGVPHAFWNPAERPARLLEIITPAGFERFFDEMHAVWPGEGEPSDEDYAKIDAINRAYGLDMDMESVPRLMEAYGLRG